MRSKYFYGLPILFLIFFILGCATGGTFPIHLKYQPDREFPSLQSLQFRLGNSLGIVPFKDERSDTFYIGHHTTLQRVSSRFKSDPLPLEKAFGDFLAHALS